MVMQRHAAASYSRYAKVRQQRHSGNRYSVGLCLFRISHSRSAWAFSTHLAIDTDAKIRRSQGSPDKTTRGEETRKAGGAAREKVGAARGPQAPEIRATDRTPRPGQRPDSPLAQRNAPTARRPNPGRRTPAHPPGRPSPTPQRHTTLLYELQQNRTPNRTTRPRPANNPSAAAIGESFFYC